MSKVEDGELLKLSRTPTNPNDENSPFTPLVAESSWTSKYPTSPNSEEFTINQRNEKKKVEKSTSVPLGTSRIPSFRLSTPNSHGYTRVSYANEKKADDKKHERQMSRQGLHTKKESGGILFARPKSPMKSSAHIGLGLKEGRKPPHFFSKQSDSAGKPPRLVPERPKVKGSPIRPLRHAKRGASPPRLMERPTQHHTFLADAADVKHIEQGLLQLMEEFQTGNLRAFGKDSKLRQMEEIREQQENLARLHFGVGAEQDLYPPLSDDGLRMSGENMTTLMEKLAHLSEAIENLHTDSTVERRQSVANSTGPHTSEVVRTGSHLSTQPSSSPVGTSEQTALDHVIPTPNSSHSTTPPHVPVRQQGQSPPSSSARDSNPSVQLPTTNVPSSATPLIASIGNLDDSSGQSTHLFTAKCNSQKEGMTNHSSTRNTKMGSTMHSTNCQDSGIMAVNANSLSKRITDT